MIIMGKIDYLMRKTDTHSAIILVSYGRVNEDFAHAACFIRKDFRGSKQLLLLDCKNEKPLVYPKLLQDQLKYDDSVNVKKDIEGESYHRWELYCIE
jgi:hypothetical protein